MAKQIPKKKTTKKKGKQKESMTFLEWSWSWIKTIVSAIVVVMIINGVAIASFVVPTPSMENTVMTGDFLFVNKFVYRPSTPQVIPFFNIPLPYFSVKGPQEPEKGDVIVFIFPGGRDQVEPDNFQYYLKRCVATAGDTLEVKDNIVYVNGEKQPLPETGILDANSGYDPYESRKTFPIGKGYTKDNYGPVVIPKKGDIINLTPRNILQWRVFIEREGHEVASDGNNILIDGIATAKYEVERDYVFGMGDNRDHSLDSRFFGYIPEEKVVGSPLIVYWSWNPHLHFLKQFGDKISSIRWSRIGTLIN